MRLLMVTGMLLGLSSVCASQQSDTAMREIESTLDSFHLDASKADGARYFSHFTRDGVFIGTDAAERWTVAQFRAYAEPHFSKGQGWTYVPLVRHVVIADIPCRCVASFDELLDNKGYGRSRGTGMLVREQGTWKIAQYALTFPVPNDLAGGITSVIKAYEGRKAP